MFWNFLLFRGGPTIAPDGQAFKHNRAISVQASGFHSERFSFVNIYPQSFSFKMLVFFLKVDLTTVMFIQKNTCCPIILIVRNDIKISYESHKNAYMHIYIFSVDVMKTLKFSIENIELFVCSKHCIWHSHK